MREFESFAAFGRHLERVAATGIALESRAAKAGGKLIQAEAKHRIGSYQDSIGPFGAWANLAEATVQDRLAKGYTPDDPLLREGDLRNSIEVQVNGGTAVVGSAMEIAVYQEVGTATIPPRPFLGPAAIGAGHEVKHEIGHLVLAWLGGVPWPRLK